MKFNLENKITMKNTILILLVGGVGLHHGLQAQTFEVTNNGGQVYVMTGEEVWVRGLGSIENLGNGIFDNSGDIYISGDWKNEAPTLGFAGNRPTGRLILDGADQRLTGSRSTRYNNLILTGTGIKFLDVDSRCENVLDLNDREFRLDKNRFTVLDTTANAILRDAPMDDNSLSGFVSATNGGYLSREMDAVHDYWFPVGDIVQGSPRYRPVVIRPNTPGIQNYGVRMANVDATTENYDRTTKNDTICLVNPDFYHQIYRIKNNGEVDLLFGYDNNADQVKEFMAYWKPWNPISPSIPLVGVGNQISLFEVNNWDDFSSNAFAMANQAPFVNITGVNPPDPKVTIPVEFSANSTGQNTVWDFGDGNTTTVSSGNSTVIHTYVKPGSYLITVKTTNANGCEDIDQYKLEIPDIVRIYDPTGTTPNGDGVNDEFVIPFIGYDIARMSVYDRWGLLIKEIEVTTSPLIWDCTDKNGNPVPEDAYVYRIDATRPDGTVDTIVNTVTVIR